MEVGRAMLPVSLASVPISAHNLSLSEALDPKIVTLLRGWHPSSYLLFSVYSVGGSLLSGWLTSSMNTSRGKFGQAQVSYSSKTPNVIFIGDAIAMSGNVIVFNPKLILNLNGVINESILGDF